jgi:dihydroorotate dehydrogenase
MASEYKLGGADLDSPLVNAAGSINGTSPENILHEVDELAATGIGAITVGSFTVPRQEGNVITYGEPVYYYDVKKGRTYNSMGLPNLGLDEAIKMAHEIVRHGDAGGKPVIFSVSPTLPSEEIGSPSEQAAQLTYRFFDEAVVEFVELNVSCPNVVMEDGTRKPMLGYDPEGIATLIDAIRRGVGRPSGGLGIKVPPYLTDEQDQLMPEIATAIVDSKLFSFITTSNTIPNQVPKDRSSGKDILSVPNGAGGMSGPATKDIGREQLVKWKNLVGDRIEIISTLGVDSGQEIAQRRRLGAVAAGGVTFLWENQNWGEAVTKMLSDYAEAIEQRHVLKFEP